jgi:hypothetical protein
MKRICVFKPTQDDWHGSYNMDIWNGNRNQMFVEVIFNGNISAYDPTRKPTWRTCVWGNDDYGMEYDCDDGLEAWNMFLQVINMEYVNFDSLKKLGYVIA